MPRSDIDFFQILKTSIAKKVRTSYPENGQVIEEWKGDEINNFQEDLISNVNGRISEKWFYTHIKSSSKHIPRVDILNLLSSYVGYKNWLDFKEIVKTSNKSYRPNRIALVISGLLLLIAFVGLSNYYYSTKAYHFRLIDEYSHQVVEADKVKVQLLSITESAMLLIAKKDNVFEVITKDEEVRFTINSAYYKSDTITRLIKGKGLIESIPLKRDDYAIMLKVFSESKVKDWSRRRAQLNNMFADNAHIYQVYSNESIGMELFNKEEFINKLTTPIRSLKSIEVIETKYSGERINELRYKLKEQ